MEQHCAYDVCLKIIAQGSISGAIHTLCVAVVGDSRNKLVNHCMLGRVVVPEL